MRQLDTNLGDLITVFYDEFLEMYGDAELASVAAAAVINDLLAGAARRTAEATEDELELAA
ncbi:MAG: hypothetical protein JNM72_27725 [Deltaproteobacteria bacterium]|jgi:hypothetical protein|nr:hypothetical protein [Deltaproteobacteria bacterium]